MKASAQTELYLIKQELGSIISELEGIENSIRNEFEGIGNDICANRLRAVLDDRLYKARKTLSNIDTSKVREGFGEVVC
ncbi:MAG: hypothetical protein GX992_04440 [Clostridium sp.]|nr:hypothetical protein [Clostridium sp.]